MAISKFKAKCLAVLQRVKRTGKPVLVTRFGKPIAEVVPAVRAGPRLTRGSAPSSLEAASSATSCRQMVDEKDWEVLGS